MHYLVSVDRLTHIEIDAQRDWNNGREQDQEPKDVDRPPSAKSVQSDENDRECESAGTQNLLVAQTLGCQ